MTLDFITRNPLEIHNLSKQTEAESLTTLTN